MEDFMELEVGQLAPEFALLDQDGQRRALSDFAGQWIVLYFYPKDDSPGCTTEACQMRDMLPKFADMQVVVIGVSVDSVRSHKKFAEKYNLPFTLLADEDKQVVERYGVWGEKSFMGKKSVGTKRTTFLIDPDLKIAKIWLQVKPEDHATEVKAAMSELQKATVMPPKEGY